MSVLQRKNLALLGDFDLVIDGFMRQGENRLILRSAAPPNRSAAAMEKHPIDAMPP